jgi:hypothetical protein
MQLSGVKLNRVTTQSSDYTKNQNLNPKAQLSKNITNQFYKIASLILASALVLGPPIFLIATLEAVAAVEFIIPFLVFISFSAFLCVLVINVQKKINQHLKEI